MLLADFGFSSLLSKNKGRKGKEGKLSTFLGTEAYMAPEIHLRLDYNGTSVDLFAAAIILFVIVSGVPPFEQATPTDQFYRCLCTNKYSEFWSAHREVNQYSNEFVDLMNSMMAFDPTQRLSFSELVQHPWMKGPIPTEQQTLAELQRRKDIIDQQMAAEQKQQLEQQRMRQAAQQLEMNNQLSYQGP